MRLLIIPILAATAVACTAPVVDDSDVPVTAAASSECINDTEWAYSANRGATVFAHNCAYCHQADGSGQAGQVPRLAGNQALQAEPKRGIEMIMITKTPETRRHGMEVQDMVAIFDELSDGDIADVMTFVLSSWGNCAPAISVDDVNAVATALDR